MARIGLQFWKREAALAPLSAAASALAHVVLIGAWVIVTLPSQQRPNRNVDQRVWYIPPPDPTPARAASVERIRYVALAPAGIGAGFGEVGESPGVELSAVPPEPGPIGNTGADALSAAEQEGSDGADTVFTIIQVDSVAARLPESAAPRYPPELLEQRVEGQAIVQFVVDTSGRADPTSFIVIVTSHPAFARSVRDALPGMRFSAARIGATKVRQLVELPFTFNIAAPATTDTAAVRTTTRPLLP